MSLVPKSIRWRLQLWYGLILLLVLAGFGLTANRLESARQLRQVDEELHQRVSVLAGALRPSPGFRPPQPPDQPGAGVPLNPPDGERRRLGHRGGERERDFPSEEGQEPPHRMPPRLDLRLAPEDAGLFDRGNLSPYYYVIWARDGRLLIHSGTAPIPVSCPERSGAGASPAIRSRGTLREAFLFVGPGDCILVGKSIEPDLADMRRRKTWLFFTGAGILLLGLAGGWWLASRAIQPVEAISATAVRIARGDLSQRIDLAETESELGRLAGVLNSTFARLETAFAQQTQFTSDAAHELRTPVTVLLTQTQTALGRDRSAPEYRETLEACQRAAQRMRRLIESLLALARLDAGQEPMTRSPFNLAATVRESAELVQPLAAQRSIAIEVELSDLPCHGDSGRLGQVFTNLLTNAIQYNREGGRVSIQGRNEKGSLVVAVTDTGDGIAAGDLPHVFDRFYRADQARTGGANAGLGLAISRAIVEAHGGTIECQSEEGVGTSFTVRLPEP